MRLDELEKLTATETSRVEWKRSFRDGAGISQAVCALANDLGATNSTGYVLVGIQKDGEMVGVDITSRTIDQVQQELSSILHDVRLQPIPSTTITTVEADYARTVIVIAVTPYDVPPIVTFLGVAWVRVGTTTRRATEADLFSLQGLENVGPTLRDWREDIAYIREKGMIGRSQEKLPTHEFLPIGYIVQQHLARVDRPVSGYAKWADQIPASYVRNVLEGDESKAAATFEGDPNCIFTIKHIASLAPIAQLARKPMFDLKQADGIGGGQIQAVKRCRDDFRALTREIKSRLSLGPSPPAGRRSRSAAKRG